MAFNSRSDTGYFPMDLHSPEGQSYLANSTGYYPGLLDSEKAGIRGAGKGLNYNDLNTGVAPAAIDADFVRGRILRTTENIMKAEENRTQSEFQRTQDLRQGMALAAKFGGYTGVIDYLRTADPEKAIAFEKEKNSLDQAIMETDTYKTVHSNDKLKAMVEAYGAIGKIGMGIINAKPEDKESMFQGSKPMLAAILGDNVPNNLNDAYGTFLLAAAQSDPNSLKLQAQQIRTGATSSIAKLHQDYHNYIAQGGDPLSPEAIDIQKQIQSANAKADQVEDVAAQAHYKTIMQGAITDKNNFTVQSSMQAQYDKAVAPYKEKQLAINQIDTLITEYENGNPQAGEALKFAFAREMNGRGALSVPDVEAASGADSGVMQIYKKLQSAVSTGGKVSFNASEVGWLKGLSAALKKGYSQKLYDTNLYYQGQAVTYSRPPSQDGTDKGFKLKLNYVNNPSDAAIKALVANPTPQIMQDFKNKYQLAPEIYINQATGGNF